MKASAAAGDGDECGHEGRGGRRAAGAGQHPGQPAEEEVGDDGGDDSHHRDVHAERGEPAVGEEDALHQQDHRYAEHPGVRPDQDRRQGPAQEVAAGARRDGEVQHLHGEDEGGDEPGQRSGPLVEFTPGAAESDGDRTGGDDTCGGGDGCVDETVGYMHGVAPLSDVAAGGVGNAPL